MTECLLFAVMAVVDGETPTRLGQRLAPCLFCPLCWSLVLGALGLWLTLPGGGWRTRAWGAALAAASLTLLAVWLPAPRMISVSLIFYPLAALVASAAVATISSRSPVYSALWFALVLLGVSGLFLMQGAQFLSLATVVVYAGAIVVMFLFVLMLAQPAGQAFYDRLCWGAVPLASAAVAAAAIAGGMAYATTQFDGVRQLVASVLPECLDSNGDPYLAPESVLGAQIATSPEGVLSLTLAVSDAAGDETRSHERQAALARQLAIKCFDRDPSSVRLNLEPVATVQEKLLTPNHVATFGGLLFGAHLIAIEVAGTLLLAALVGAIAIAIQGRNLSPRGAAPHA